MTMRCLRKKELVLPMLPDKELEAGEEAAMLADEAATDDDEGLLHAGGIGIGVGRGHRDRVGVHRFHHTGPPRWV